LTGIHDFQELSESGDPKCQLAFDCFVDRIVGYVGSYFVKLDGKIDALVFSGGIGENSPKLRLKVVEVCRSLGFRIDSHKNEKCATKVEMVIDVGHERSERKVLVCDTDEEVSFVRPE